MNMIEVKTSGNFNNFKNFVDRMLHRDEYVNLDEYGRIGVESLMQYTPEDTGLTAHMWGYAIQRDKDRVSIIWFNNDVHEGANIAVLIQYGHGTGTGGYVEGIDYINPALRPVFQKIADDVWRQVIG